MTVIPIVIGTFESVPENSENRLEGGTGDQWKNRNYLDHSIVKKNYDTLKCPGDLKRLPITQTNEKPSVRDGVKN